MSWVRLSTLGLALALATGMGCGSDEDSGAAYRESTASGGSGGAGMFAGSGGIGARGGSGGAGGTGVAGMMVPQPTAGMSPPPSGGIGGAAGGVGGSAGAGAGGLGGMPIGGLGGAPPPSGGSPGPVPVAEGMPTHVPTPKGSCPDISTGSVTVSLNGGSVQFRLWVGSGMGPALIYWHGTGGSSSEASSAMSPAIAHVQSQGGMVAAPEVTSATGSTTGNLVWYTGDVDFADEVIACAIEQGKVDPARIHVAGYSAGGLQTVYHWYARSGYVASVLSYSGGSSFINVAPLQNPSWVPPAIAAHGAEGSDWLALDFKLASDAWTADAIAKGGFAIDCDDGGSHIDVFSRFAVADAGWQFFLDHPWGVAPLPYEASLPGGFPSYCKIL